MASSSESNSDMDKGTTSDVEMKQALPGNPPEDEPPEMVSNKEEEYSLVRTGVAKAFPKPASGILSPLTCYCERIQPLVSLSGLHKKSLLRSSVTSLRKRIKLSHWPCLGPWWMKN